ncbi:Uncharacterised protein [Arcanobacterium haemolyticum]|uniref:hypothetical protein n=1 Tax=Arcanobacterium haemolyticum TaxID=28264 RepID=UPI000D9F5D08|nr:hypothetical protein [Arcanobacterium haemolyticum]SPT74915.1 Uncharacterised protein [Arcanobacterium haemolyticum]
MKVNFACEGKSDLPFLVSMIRATGNEVGEKIVKRGCVNLDNAIPQYAQAASYFPGELWLVVRDADGQCPVELRGRLNPAGVPDTFLLRIAAKHWDANRARKCDESLDRAMRALEAHVSF